MDFKTAQEERFRGQVHENQYSIDFHPEPGDIIVRRVTDPENLKPNDHETNVKLAVSSLVELYKDTFYAFPERCPDPAKRDAYYRIFFRNGDHIIRRGRFKRKHNYQYRDKPVIRVWVYWPGYQLHTPFVRLNSSCPNLYPTRFYKRRFGTYRCRAQTLRFDEKEVLWEAGDLIVRYFEPGPPGAPNPGWYRLLGTQQVGPDSQMSYAREGDILIKMRGRPEDPTIPADPVRMNTRMEIYCYLLTRGREFQVHPDVDDEKTTHRWMYLGGDTMLYDFNDWDSVMKFSTVAGVPQPADIMISLNEEFVKYDNQTQIGGYVKFYQNAATSVDPKAPKTTVHHPTRVPADGATRSAAAPPDLPQPEMQAAWIEPRWDHLAVPLPEAAHPMVLRFGRWAVENTKDPDPVYRWIWHPHLEMYQRHPRSFDGNTFLLSDTTGVDYGDGKSHAAWEEFHEGTELNSCIQAERFTVLKGDCIIRRDLRHRAHPILTHALLPATDTEGYLMCCPGDLLVRYGIIPANESPPLDSQEPLGNRYHFGVELYVFVLDHDRTPVWQLRGRDQVIFGAIHRPGAKKRKTKDSARLTGVHDGSKYQYDAPSSLTFRCAVLASEEVEPVTAEREVAAPRGSFIAAEIAGVTARGGVVLNPEIAAGDGNPTPNEGERGGSKTQDPKPERRKSRRKSRGEVDEQSTDNKDFRPKNIVKPKIIKATRQKLVHTLLIPTFPNHETGNYKRDFQGND